MSARPETEGLRPFARGAPPGTGIDEDSATPVADAPWPPGTVVAHPAPLWIRAVISAPDQLLGGFLAVCIVVAIFLQLHQFRWFLVLPTTAVAVVLTRRWMPRYLPRRDGESSAKAASWGAAIALAMAAIFLALNLPHADQILYADRDPQMYLLRGFYLIDHPSPVVGVRPETLAVAQQIPGIYTGIYAGPPQSTAPTWAAGLLPGLIGLTGWFGGQYVALHANVVIGAIGLVALYAAARRLLGPLWALLPVLALGASMPMVAFSRAAFSEPTAMVLFCGALVCLWVALRRNLVCSAALAGAFAGAITFARIDGPLVVLGGLACLGTCGALARSPDIKRGARRMVLSFGAAATLLTALGFLDLASNSGLYLQKHDTEWIPLLAGTVVVFASAMAATSRWHWITTVGTLVARHRTTFALTAGGAVMAAAVALVTRPWWWVAHNNTYTAVQAVAAELQRSVGLPIDPSRSYDELSMIWQAWYLGWGLLALSVLGSVLISICAIRERNGAFAVWIALVGAAGLPYLVMRFSGWLFIDQIWVERRFLPAVIPGMLVFATFLTRAIIRWISGRRWASWSTPLAVVVAVAVFTGPVTTWGGLFFVTQGNSLYTMSHLLCSAVRGHRVVYAAPVEPLGIADLMGMLQNVCDSDAVWVSDPSTATLSRLTTTWRGAGSVYLVTLDPARVRWLGSSHDPEVSADYPVWEQTVMRRPAKAIAQHMSIWIGVVGRSGLVVPLPLDAPHATR